LIFGHSFSWNGSPKADSVLAPILHHESALDGKICERELAEVLPRGLVIGASSLKFTAEVPKKAVSFARLDLSYVLATILTEMDTLILARLWLAVVVCSDSLVAVILRAHAVTQVRPSAVQAVAVDVVHLLPCVSVQQKSV
jgi:hypothetical protein